MSESRVICRVVYILHANGRGFFFFFLCRLIRSGISIVRSVGLLLQSQKQLRHPRRKNLRKKHRRKSLLRPRRRKLKKNLRKKRPRRSLLLQRRRMLRKSPRKKRPKNVHLQQLRRSQSWRRLLPRSLWNLQQRQRRFH